MIKLLLAFLLLPLCSISQSILPYKDGRIVYEVIDNTKGLSKTVLYASSKKWLTDNFTSVKAVIQSEDIETGQIIGMGNLVVSEIAPTGMFMYVYRLQFKIQIDCRDEKYRLRFYDVEDYNSSTNTGVPFEEVITSSLNKVSSKRQARFVTVLKDTNNKFTNLIESYKRSVNQANLDAF